MSWGFEIKYRLYSRGFSVVLPTGPSDHLPGFILPHIADNEWLLTVFCVLCSLPHTHGSACIGWLLLFCCPTKAPGLAQVCHLELPCKPYLSHFCPGITSPWVSAGSRSQPSGSLASSLIPCAQLT